MNAPAPEFSTIDLINKEAWDKRNSDSMRSSLLSDEAIGLSRSINYRKGLAEGLRTYGYALFRHSSFEIAVGFLDESMHLFLETGNENGQADINEIRGVMTRNHGEYKTAIQFLYAACELKRKNHDREGLARVIYQLGITCRDLGLTARAMDFFHQGLDAASLIHLTENVSDCLRQIGCILLELQQPDEALTYFQKSLALEDKEGDQKTSAACLCDIGRSYLMMKKPDEAIEFFQKALEHSMNIADTIGSGVTLYHLAETALTLSQPELAQEYAHRCYAAQIANHDKIGQAEALMLLAGLQQDKKKLTLLNNALDLSQAAGSGKLCSAAHHQLYIYYKDHRITDKALEHLEQYLTCLKDIQFRTLKERTEGLQWLHEEEMVWKDSEIDYLQKVKLAELESENEAKKGALTLAAEDLKNAQKKLLQNEKMAFIGELTAGIAQEIQQTLTMINSLSEKAEGEVDHLNVEIRNRNQAAILKIIPELKNNLKKIHFQSKREEVTVKSMLRHILHSNNKREKTDINKLVDDYLRISYQGMRLKDKSFNARLDTFFDPRTGSISVIANDIGNILLTILNNAFIAVNDQRKMSGSDYEPVVSVKTMKQEGLIKICIYDNGMAIPESLKEKIFQPFFSGGEGLVPGLYLCYEMAKAYGGDIILTTPSANKPGQQTGGTEFVIILPDLI